MNINQIELSEIADIYTQQNAQKCVNFKHVFV